MRHITKRFGSVTANDAASLSVERGDIHALVGENGAGKTTLMNILYGMYSPTAGEIFINGTARKFSSPRDAIRLGIGMVHQHFMLIPPLTVTENVILGKEITGAFSFIDTSKAERTLSALAGQFHLEVDAGAKISTLSVGLQQRVEILKILYREADILILDEPTPVLTPQEAEGLFRTLRNLKEDGKTVILITHKLSEVIAISDRVTVMRQGRVVAHLETKNTTMSELARLMVGKETSPSSVHGATSASAGEPALTARNLSALNDRRLPALKGVSFSVYRGEILGIAAVEGNGQSELVEVLTGLRTPTAGEVRVGTLTLEEAFRRSMIAHIPEDRRKRGLVQDLSITENLLLGRHREHRFLSRSFLSREAIDQYAESAIREFDIRPASKDLPIRSLSGGNQQKVIIARELSKGAPVIIASQPTRGLDIGAIEFVHRQLLLERGHGNAVLVVSSDLEELLLLSDRIAVMYEGEIVAVLDARRTSERELGSYMTGAKRRSA